MGAFVIKFVYVRDYYLNYSKHSANFPRHLDLYTYLKSSGIRLLVDNFNWLSI